MSSKVNILGVKVDKVTIDEASDKIMEYIKTKDRVASVFTPNSEIIMMGYRDSEFRDILNNSELLTADGIGVVYASKIVKNPIKERAAGYDIACSALEKLAKVGGSVYLLAQNPVLPKLQERILLKSIPVLKLPVTATVILTKKKKKQL